MQKGKKDKEPSSGSDSSVEKKEVLRSLHGAPGQRHTKAT